MSEERNWTGLEGPLNPPIEFMTPPDEEETVDKRPHSRACGWRQHEHGRSCSTNCPTCHGVDNAK